MNKCVDIAMTQCMWCGEATGIAVGKKLTDCKDKYATKYVFNGYEPCDKCKEQWNKGFVFIEAQNEPMVEGQPEIQDGVYPTGNIWVVANESARKMFNEDVVDKMLNYGKCFIDNAIAKKLGLYGEQNEQS